MKRIAINAFIIFHLATILCWSMPVNSRLFTNARPLIAPYMVWSGLAQGWNLFAPNPLAMNLRLEVEVTHQGGQTSVWKFSRPEDAGYIKRYTLERQHKFSLDALQNDKLAYLRPDAARYIARLNNSNPSNPPVSLKFVSYQSKIAPPNSGKPEPWVRKDLYTYHVQPGDLK